MDLPFKPAPDRALLTDLARPRSDEPDRLKVIDSILAILPLGEMRSYHEITAIFFAANIEHLQRHQRPIFEEDYINQDGQPKGAKTHRFLKRIGYGNAVHPAIAGMHKKIRCQQRAAPETLTPGEASCLRWAREKYLRKADPCLLFKSIPAWGVLSKQVGESNRVKLEDLFEEILKEDPKTAPEYQQAAREWRGGLQKKNITLPEKSYQKMGLLQQYAKEHACNPESTGIALDLLITALPEEALQGLTAWPATLHGTNQHFTFLERVALHLPGGESPAKRKGIEEAILAGLQQSDNLVEDYLDLADEIGLQWKREEILNWIDKAVKDICAEGPHGYITEEDGEILDLCLTQLEQQSEHPKTLGLCYHMFRDEDNPDWLRWKAGDLTASILHKHPGEIQAQRFFDDFCHDVRSGINRTKGCYTEDMEEELKCFLRIISARVGGEAVKVGEILREDPEATQVYHRILKQYLECYQGWNNGQGHPWLSARSIAVGKHCDLLGIEPPRACQSGRLRQRR